MRKRSLRVLSQILCLVLLASVFLQAPLEAAQAIPVNVGGQTFNVTPGQWVSVRQGTSVQHYNVRFVDGRPVALEMSQYTRLIFGGGDAAAATGASAGSTAPAAPSSPNAPAVADSSAGSPSPVGGATTAPADVPQSGQPAQAPQQTQTTQSSQPVQQTQPTQSAQPAEVAQPTQSAQTSQTAQTGSTVQAGDASQAAQSGAAAQVSESVTTTETTTTRTRNWDPSRHPRDPQTGRFISHEEAIARGIMEPPPGHPMAEGGQQVAQSSGDASQAAQSGDASQAAQSGDASQAAQSGDASQAAQSGDASQAAQSGDASQAAQSGAAAGQVADGGKTGSTVSGKFQEGYMAGKQMTNQGFQNVKDSLQSGFSAQNLLMTAGITVGVDLATQVMRGDNPSLGAALRTVASAEFVGSVGGSVMGAAAGSFFVPFLSAVPVVGGVLGALAPAFGSVAGSSMGAYLAGDLRNGRFSIREAFRRIDWVGVTGQAIGSTAGAALGSALGPIGTIAGGMIGGYLGNWAAQRIAGMFGRDQVANLPEMKMPTGSSSPVSGFTGPVTIGGSDPVISDKAPAAPSQGSVAAAPVAPAGPGATEQVQMAYSKYQELYQLYNEMLRQGRNEDALEVAAAMNEAKAAYDSLRNEN